MTLDQFIAEFQRPAAEPGSRTAGLLPLLSTLISDTPTRFAEQADLCMAGGSLVDACSVGERYLWPRTATGR